MISSHRKITEFSVSLSGTRQLKEDIAEAEIRLSAFIAEHNLPFLVMDHLPKVTAKICPDSKTAQGLACARKKTTGIVRNVLGTESFKNLCDDLRRRKFSLIIDESTDRSTKKHLCLVFNQQNLQHKQQLSLLKLGKC
ncbi:uncharacterized protein [Diabrotica undecimpunctata]|uniref:uncharacterized protein n=1 Tax=Diabrotica undecimpunctata TaxID=50387 RepID=UPI003B63589B